MELYPERAGWTMRSMLEAQLIDTVNMLRWELAVSNTPKGRGKPPKPEPIPRPGVKSNVKHWGKDPIRRSRFNDWWDSKRKN